MKCGVTLQPCECDTHANETYSEKWLTSTLRGELSKEQATTCSQLILHMSTKLFRNDISLFQTGQVTMLSKNLCVKHASKFLILKILGKMNVNYMTIYGASMNQSSIIALYLCKWPNENITKHNKPGVKLTFSLTRDKQIVKMTNHLPGIQVGVLTNRSWNTDLRDGMKRR